VSAFAIPIPIESQDINHENAQMNTRKRNQWFVTLFLFAVVGFTALMTFGVGPKMMALRDEVDNAAILYKCQVIHNGNELELQLRSSERPNPNPLIPVRLAGLSSPPPLEAEDPILIAWAEKHGVDPEQASMIGEAAHKTLLAFIRKQNLWVERADGVSLQNGLEAYAGVHVQVSGSPVGVKQLESGLAVYVPGEPQLYAEDYQAAQEAAKQAGQGIWSKP